jgi:uncharacterized membrane protein
MDRQALRELAALGSLGVAGVVLVHYETPRMLFHTNHSPASGLAATAAATVALAVVAAAARARRGDQPAWRLSGVRVWTVLVDVAGAAALWTLAAAILGAGQLALSTPTTVAIHDRFQQGHVLVSISWALVGLALVIASLRGERGRLRAGGIALLFVAVGKLFLYDLAYLTAMARAISFIVSGSVLLVAALVLQSFGQRVRAALGDEEMREAS